MAERHPLALPERHCWTSQQWHPARFAGVHLLARQFVSRIKLCVQLIELDVLVSAREIHAEARNELTISRRGSKANDKVLIWNLPIGVLLVKGIALVRPAEYLQWLGKNDHRMNVLGMIGVDVNSQH
jgi:hypothetical protein